MSSKRTQVPVDLFSASSKPPNGSTPLSPDIPPVGQPAHPLQQSSPDVGAVDAAAGSPSPSSLSARDFLTQLSLSDIVADSCDSSRILVNNVDVSATDEELAVLFSKFGDIESITTPAENKRTRIISFFDIRSAGRACNYAGTCLLKGKPLLLQYATGTDGEDDDYDGCSLRVYGLPPVLSNGDMFRLFGRFGDVKDIREGDQDDRARRCLIVEFFDSRDARNARECFNNIDILGSRITVGACRTVPLWQRRRRWQQQMLGNQPQMARQTHPTHRPVGHKSSQSWDQMRVVEPSSEIIFTRPGQFNIVQSARGTESSGTASTVSSAGNSMYTPPVMDASSSDPAFRERLMQSAQQKSMISSPDFSTSETNSAPILPSMSNYEFFSPLANPNMSPQANYGFDGNRSAAAAAPAYAPAELKNRASSASMSNLIQIPPRGMMEMQQRPQFYSPTAFRSISGTIHNPSAGSQSGRYHEMSSSSTSSPVVSQQHRQSGGNSYTPGRSSLAPRRGPQDVRQDYYSIVIVGGRVLDSRTTLMIRNIPNKYTQRMLIEQYRENPGCYDFLYLPIDFKNNCNVGYAFVNMVSTDFLPAFYASLHNKRWERFNSEKVCEIAYARIQGLEQLLEHFKNSSLLAEDKKVRPVILLNGRYVPFPDPDVVIRVGSSGNHKFLLTDDPEYL